MEIAIGLGLAVCFFIGGMLVGACLILDESERITKEYIKDYVEEITDLKRIRKLNEKTITNLSKDNFNKAGKIRTIQQLLNQQNYGSTENLINKIKSVLDEPEHFI